MITCLAFSRGPAAWLALGVLCLLAYPCLGGCRAPLHGTRHHTRLSPVHSTLSPRHPPAYYTERHFFGYHESCWRAWPEGWISCPNPCWGGIPAEAVPLEELPDASSQVPVADSPDTRLPDTRLPETGREGDLLPPTDAEPPSPPSTPAPPASSGLHSPSVLRATTSQSSARRIAPSPDDQDSDNSANTLGVVRYNSVIPAAREEEVLASQIESWLEAHSSRSAERSAAD